MTSVHGKSIRIVVEIRRCISSIITGRQMVKFRISGGGGDGGKGRGRG